MNNFLNRIASAIQRFMYGRYGNDQLGNFIFILYIVISLTASLFRINSIVVSILMGVLVFIYLYRFFSKKLSKRRTENQKFMEFYGPIERWVKKKINRLKKMKEYKYFKCPNCKTELRVPRGKGNISVTCPKCRATFDKKS